MTKPLTLAIAGSAFCLSALTAGFLGPREGTSESSPGHPPFFLPYQYSSFAGDTALYAEAYKDASTPPVFERSIGTIAAGTISHHLFAKDLIAGYFVRLAGLVHPRTIILIGPNHHARGRSPIAISAMRWRTPFGFVEPDSEAIAKLAGTGLAAVEEEPFLYEHSIGALVPFIRASFPGTRIVPVIFKSTANREDCVRLAGTLSRLTESPLVLASLDFSHYKTSREAEQEDAASLSVLESLSVERVDEAFVDSRPVLLTLLSLCRDIGAERVQVVQHTNSGLMSHQLRVACTSYINTFISAPEKDARRAPAMNPEDPLVLTWLKAVQDGSSAARRLVPSQEGDDAGQTFNNSIVAIAFMVKQERERAERILDFYSEATVVENRDSTLQNFFLRGEARGFYQEVSISTLHNAGNGSDRWIGDMAWLLCACKYYEKEYHSAKYGRLASLLRDLLVSFYRPSAHGGYIQSGWRHRDAYRHEPNGHHEGNIDCYAVLRMCGEDTLAAHIRAWIDDALRGLPDLPLDLYTWRVLAFGPESAGLLRIPEEDPRYRKTIMLRGHRVTGLYHGADAARENIWTDGVGHIACAYETCGDAAKGYFYANQLDSMMIERRIDGVMTHALSYTANRSGGYDWVDTTRGFTSCAAWYILAKNGVNPFRPQ